MPTARSNMHVEEYEQSCRKKLEEQSEAYENLIVYFRTGKHKKGLTAKNRKQVLRMASSYQWDDAEKVLYYNGGDTKKKVVMSMEEIATILRLYHSNATAGHSGYRATHEKVSKSYYWRGMVKDIKHYVETCQGCQRYTPIKTQAPQMQSIKVKKPLELVGMNLMESDCKDKCHQLRSKFMREKRKITTQPSRSANIKTKNWVFYDAMEFFMPHVTPRATSSNVPPLPDEDNSYDIDDAAPDDNSSTINIMHAPDIVPSQQTATNVDVCKGGSRPTPAINKPSSTAKKPNTNKRRHCEFPSEVDEQIVEEMQKWRKQAVCDNENELDPDRQFLLSLLPLMKRLSPVDSIDIKIEIHQAFRRKLIKDQNSSYGYWTDQHPSHTPSPYTSDSNSN